MKSKPIKAAILLAITLGLSATAQAQKQPVQKPISKGSPMTNPTYVQEYKAIAEVLNKYIEGCKQANSSIMVSTVMCYEAGMQGKSD